MSNHTSAGDLRTSVRTATFAFMRQVGVDTIFGNPGSTELGMFYDFPADFRYVLGLQEASVVGMADGYAQASGNAAFVNLHSAAGVGNAMGNIFTAFKNKTPLVITAGQQARSLFPHDPYLYSANATELPKPYVKWSIEPARAEDVPLAIARAYQLAMLPPRGPVLVSIPSDDWDKPCPPVGPTRVDAAQQAEQAGLLEVARDLEGARRPALVVGAEVDRSGSWDALVELAEKVGAWVFVAPLASRRGFPEDHPQFSGFLPANAAAIRAQLSAHDVVFVVGAPAFTFHVESQGPAIDAHTRLHLLSCDPEVVARVQRGHALLGSIGPSLRWLNAQPYTPKGERPTSLARPPAPDQDGGLGAAHVLDALARTRQAQDIIVEEAPTARLVMNEHLPILRPGTFYTMDSGGLGFGMPAAVGIALAMPSRRVLCVIGDGSAMYSEQAMWTAAQLGLNVKFIVLNNGRYAAMKRFARVFDFPPGMPVVGTDLPGLDFVALAAGHGVPGVRASTLAQLGAAIGSAFETTGPALIEAVVP